MKYPLYFFLFLLFANCKDQKPEFVKAEITPTKIDSLSSKKQVEDYVGQLRYPSVKGFKSSTSDVMPNFLDGFKLKKINEFDRGSIFDLDSITKIIADSLNISKSFYKADIDNNGFTDLLVIGNYVYYHFAVYCFMNFGNDSIIPVDLIIKDIEYSMVPKISKKYDDPTLEIHEPAQYHWIKKKKLSENKVIDLTFKFGSFIEYNKKPKDHHIEKIEFQTEISGYKHPHFEIHIKDDQSALLKAKYGNSLYEYTKVYYKDTIPELKGEFKSTIKTDDYNTLTNLLNYMDFPNMKNRYVLRNLHTYDCTLKITYNNGKVKEINDSGMLGTYGLRRVYELLFDFRFNQEWELMQLNK